MSSLNRGRYEIEIGDGWKRFSDPIPASNMLGVVRIGEVEGALVRHVSTGDFLLVRAGRVMTLLARKVEAAIEERGQQLRSKHVW